MDIEKRILAIETLLKSLESGSDIEKLQTYSTIKFISNELLAYTLERRAEGDSIDHNSARGYMAELYGHLESMTGLRNQSHPFDQEMLWAQTYIAKLRSPVCFDIEPEKHEHEENRQFHLPV